MVKHFTYDGLGRLLRTQSPYPDPDTSDGRVFSERYYYDGVRRIQEVTTTPLASSGMAMSQGGELNQILSQTTGASATQTDGESAPVAFEQGQVSAALSGGLETGIAVGVAREYVWGPGDRGIDELLIQYDKNRKAWYAIQDSGGDIVALCDVPTSGTARVAGQWTYDAYGSVIFAEHLVSHQPLHCGHKAAFVERLDVGVYSSSSSENHRLIPFAHSISHMRNRVYAPGIGRFMQPDPNATASVLLEASSYHGRGIGAEPMLFEMKKLYGDGLSLYQYLKSNALSNSDPSGLEVEGEEEENFFSAEDLFENVTDIMGLMDPVPGPSDMIRGAIKGLVEGYAQNLSADVDWASDWSQADDDHSRLDDDWIMFAMGKGVYEEFDVGLPFSDKSVNPLDWAAKKNSNGGGGGSVKKAVGKLRGGYTIHCANGHEAHRRFSEQMKSRGIRHVNRKIDGGTGRPDAINYVTREVWELKPFSPSGVLRGYRQLQGYVAELERLTGQKWTSHLVFYAP